MYAIAQRLSLHHGVVVLRVHGDDSNTWYVHFQQILNALRLFRISREARRRTIAIVQRVVSPLPRVALLALWHRMTRQTLIYDFDDAIYLLRPRTTSFLCRASDAVIVSNRFLRDYAIQLNPKVFVVPTSIDSDLYRRRPKNTSGPLVIGWIGTPSNLQYLRVLDGPLRRLRDRFDFQFFVITDYKFRSSIPLDPELVTRVIDWEYPGFVEKLSEFDIGVCPLPLDRWTQGKSGYKTLEYMALGIPVVASPVGDNRNIILDGNNGYLAANDEEWVNKLGSLIGSRELRSRIGDAGMQTVNKSYTTERAVAELERILPSV